MVVQVDKIPRIEHPADIVDNTDTSDGSTSRSVSTQDSEEQTIVNIVNKRLWGNDPSAVAHALTTLAELCFEKTNENAVHNRKEVGSRGGLLAIVKAMEKFRHDADLQVKGIRALSNSAVNSENKRMLFDLDAVEIAVETMGKFANVNAQFQGCALFDTLSSGPGGNAKLVADAGGIRAVVRAMKAFPGNSDVQMRACFALEYMAKVSEEIKCMVVQAGGAVLVATVLQNHYDMPDVKDGAKKALDAL